MSQPTPEIALRWEPPHPRSQVWFNVPLYTRRTVTLIIQPRISEDFSVIIKEPLSTWLKVARRTGKVPFKTTVTVDTSRLGSGEGFKEELEFQVEGVTIYREPIYLTTQLYDPAEEQILQQPFVPLHASKPRKNILISIYTAISTAYNIGCAFVILLIAVFVVCLVLILLAAA